MSSTPTDPIEDDLDDEGRIPMADELQEGEEEEPEVDSEVTKEDDSKENVRIQYFIFLNSN